MTGVQFSTWSFGQFIYLIDKCIIIVHCGKQNGKARYKNDFIQLLRAYVSLCLNNSCILRCGGNNICSLQVGKQLNY